MSVRVLIIDDQNDFRRLLAHHISTGFDSPAIAEYDPVARGRLPLLVRSQLLNQFWNVWHDDTLAAIPYPP